MKPFWMVHGEGTREPQKRHEARESAVIEAQRLARCNPGRSFTVLRSTHTYVRRDVDVFAHDDPDDMAHLTGAAALLDDSDIPF